MGNLPELIAQFQSAARFYFDLAFRNGRDLPDLQNEADTFAAMNRLVEAGKALAAELERAGQDSTGLYSLLDAAFMRLEKDRYLAAWEPLRVSLARMATVAALTPPADKRSAGFPFTRDSYPLWMVAEDLKAIQEGYSLEQPEARAAHRSEGFARLETFCIAEAGEFTPAVLRKLCAVAARRTGKTLRDVLSLAIVAGAELLEAYATSNTDSTPPTAKPSEAEGNGGDGAIYFNRWQRYPYRNCPIEALSPEDTIAPTEAMFSIIKAAFPDANPLRLPWPQIRARIEAELGIVLDWPNRDAETTIALLAKANRVREGKTPPTAEPDESEGNGKADKSTEPLLGERAQLVLTVLRNGKAFDSDHRMRTSDIAAKAAGKQADPNQYKEVIAGLKRLGYVDTKEGRSGGCWLTTAGQRRAGKL